MPGMQGSVVHLVLIGREAIRLGFGRLSESSVARIVSTFPFPNVDPVLHLTVSDPHSRLAAETPPDCPPPPPAAPHTSEKDLIKPLTIGRDNLFIAALDSARTWTELSLSALFQTAGQLLNISLNCLLCRGARRHASPQSLSALKRGLTPDDTSSGHDYHMSWFVHQSGAQTTTCVFVFDVMGYYHSSFYQRTPFPQAPWPPARSLPQDQPSSISFLDA